MATFNLQCLMKEKRSQHMQLLVRFWADISSLIIRASFLKQTARSDVINFDVLVSAP